MQAIPIVSYYKRVPELSFYRGDIPDIGRFIPNFVGVPPIESQMFFKRTGRTYALHVPGSTFFQRRRQSPYFKRTVPGVGMFIPTAGDIQEMMDWSHRLAGIFVKTKMAHVYSPLNTVEDFHGKGIFALSTTLHKYPGFLDRTEYEKLCKSSISNRMKDHIRDLFRQKRWGFTVNYVEESNDDEISTVASVGCHTVSLNHLEDLTHGTDLPEIQLQDLLTQFQSRLSPEAYDVLLELLEGVEFDADYRATHSTLFQELQSIAMDLYDKGQLLVLESYRNLLRSSRPSFSNNLFNTFLQCQCQ